MIQSYKISKLFFYSIIFFISSGVILGQDVQVNHYTPNGSLVNNVYDTEEMSSSDIIYWNNYITTNYPNVTILEPATREYNCHGYVWSVVEGGNEVWIGYSQSGVEEIFWEDNSYVAVSENIATKVSYSGDHSAVTTTTQDYYISKWNRYPLVYHHKNDHPGYGVANEFFKRYVAAATVSPTTNNVGSGRMGDSFNGSFTIANTGGVTLNLTIQSPLWGVDLEGQTPGHFVYRFLLPGWNTTIDYSGDYGMHDYGPFTQTVLIYDNSNSINKTHSIVGTRLLPDFCYGETQSKSLSPEEQLFDGAFLGYFDFESDSIRFDISKSIRERLSFAYDLLEQPETEKVENICKMIIELYPESEMGISFYAMGLLSEASYSDEAPDFKEKDFIEYLKNLTNQKIKYKINGYAQLVLSLLNVGKDITGLEKLFKEYEYDILKELALFHQFIHYFVYEDDKETARKISDNLDEMFKDSRYGYQAHIMFGDKGYTLEGLLELVKKQQSSLLAKRGEIKTDILSELPTEYKLFNNYPNPFNPSTTIKYSVPTVSAVKLSVYNMMGQLIKTLVNETKAPGFYNVEWNGTNENSLKVTSGIYFYRFESGNFVTNNKMILLK